MPVENVFGNGSIMYNKTNPHSALSESVYSLLGDILEDDEFNEETLKLIKDKDKSIKPYWRYLTASQAKAKRAEREELEELAAELDEDNEDETENTSVKATSNDKD